MNIIVDLYQHSTKCKDGVILIFKKKGKMCMCVCVSMSATNYICFRTTVKCQDNNTYAGQGNAPTDNQTIQ